MLAFSTMNRNVVLHPYQKILLRIFLLAFVVSVASGYVSADFNGIKPKDNVCFAVKPAFDAPAAGVAKSAQVLHAAPLFTLPVLTGRPIFALHQFRQSSFFELKLVPPSRAPPLPCFS